MSNLIDRVSQLTALLNTVGELSNDPSNPIMTVDGDTVTVNSVRLKEIQGIIGDIQYLFPYVNRSIKESKSKT